LEFKVEVEQFSQLLGKQLRQLFFTELPTTRCLKRVIRMRDEASYLCDGCGEEIVIPIDMSQGASQEYVEDCPVCCQPNIVHVEIDPDGEPQVWSEPEEE